jgi:hypothetical protein
MSRCACREPNTEYESRAEFFTTLSASFGQTEYTRDAPSARHAGQLKLLCCEIRFLKRYGFKRPYTVVYAGSAPGIHIPTLAALFPLARFVLVDPAESAVVTNPPRVRVLRARMTEALARALAPLDSRMLFISDVRVGPQAGESHADQQRRIHADMEAQQAWHECLNPAASMLKFRLPWDLQPTTQYLEGEIHLPVYGKHLTHEARLVVRRGARRVPYDNALYERQMAYFNRVLRIATYDGGLCYDCSAFRRIVAEYAGCKRHVDPGVEEACAWMEAELEACKDVFFGESPHTRPSAQGPDE